MIKVLFLIHDLGQGGAERVLVNLTRHMNHEEFQITVMTLFNKGENIKLLDERVEYKYWMPIMMRGNSHLMKLLSPKQLHKLIVKEHYDIEIAYLEGPTSRVISGNEDPDVVTISWIHNRPSSLKTISRSFRNEEEAIQAYSSFDEIIFVSEDVRTSFLKHMKKNLPTKTLYNTNDTEKILEFSKEHVDGYSDDPVFKIIAIGKLLNSKGFDSLLRVTDKLIRNGYQFRLYILGDGPERNNYQQFIHDNNLEDSAVLLGYQMNPYKYLAQADLFVCSSHSEGFSTAATEALILGIPVCTVEVSGMREMLGDSEFGLIVPDTETDLYLGIKKLLDDGELLAYYKKQAALRGKMFKREETVVAVENMLKELLKEKKK